MLDTYSKLKLGRFTELQINFDSILLFFMIFIKTIKKFTYKIHFFKLLIQFCLILSILSDDTLCNFWLNLLSNEMIFEK